MSSVFAWDAGLVGGWLPTFLLVLFITLFFLNIFQGRPKNFPPGMTILPVVGSLLSMPYGPSLEVMRGLRKKYGDIASFAIFGTRVVLVSGVHLIKEVFAQTSTAGRPEVMMFAPRNYMITKGRTSNIGVISASGPVWQVQQRFLLQHLRNLGNTSYEPIMVDEISDLLDHLAKDEGTPVKMSYLFHRSVINILWAMVLGRRYPYGHEKLKKAEEFFFLPAHYNLLSPINHIPHICKVIDYLPIKRQLMMKIKKTYKFLEEEFKDTLADENLRDSNHFLSLYMEEMEKNPNFKMEHLEAVVNDLFAGGMEPGSSTLTTIVYLMTKHPQVQHRVREELDEVVGRDRLPSVTDMERLPYTQATIHEAQRVFELTKYALPHKADEDCTIGGYDIPKGTWLLPNLDDNNRSFENWKSPLVFDPHNFLDENGKFKKNDAFMAFGVGKRVCTGEHMARMELFLFFTHMFQRFTVTLAEEEQPILVDANPMFSAPPLYTAIFKSRPKYAGAS